MKYRVGKKQKRSILREDGTEVVILPDGMQDEAARLCNLLNVDDELKKFVDQEFEIAKIDLKEFESTDEFQYGLYQGYYDALKLVKEKYDELYSRRN